MDVVFDSIYLEQETVLILNNAPDIPVEFFFVFWIDGRDIVFGPEYDVNQDLTIAAHGVQVLVQPLSGLGFDIW